MTTWVRSNGVVSFQAKFKGHGRHSRCFLGCCTLSCPQCNTDRPRSADGSKRFFTTMCRLPGLRGLVTLLLCLRESSILTKKDEKWDHLGLAAAELGTTLLCSCSDYWAHLGETHLGCSVELGATSHHCTHYVSHLYRILYGTQFRWWGGADS